MRLTQSSPFQFSLVILLVSLLSACGFHLRGDYDIPDALDTMSFTSYDEYSTFTRVVKRQLRMNEINLVTPAENVPNLTLVSESISERTLSLYQNTRAAEKELTFHAVYRVTIPEIGDKTFTTSVTRSYLDNPLSALAKSVERDMLEDEMRKLAASQIIRQMARLKANIEAGTMNLDKDGAKISTKEMAQQEADRKAQEKVGSDLSNSDSVN
ncbi:LPS-assembly lipoprotein LptE [Vibrio porteresiae]|uniref:LPS-assembly lipoprotein LptE n=1 Tax=Vibrio porteresiae DSM 19223 TaxID=1123496 RepID=A0ABZ0QBH5_9VIBR|nr:LPS assembly lipoprotein LptE [Vibrio porteresiae]WPC73326.1 LPS assembly lipoprotein LptE [Vibrio porteresiae DSM 19223]